MTNPVSNQGSQFSHYVSQSLDLEEKFNASGNIQNLPSLQRMHKLAAVLEIIGGKFIGSATMDESSEELLFETHGKVMSIAGDLAHRIKALPAPKVILPSISSAPETRPALETFFAMVRSIYKRMTIETLEPLYNELPSENRREIFKNLWRVRGCPTTESTISSIKELHHEDFGLVSFFDIQHLCASTSLQKRLALELCMTPSLMIEQIIYYVAVDEIDKALILFDLLPEKIQKTAFKNLWATLGGDPVLRDKKSNKEFFSNFLTSKMYGRSEKKSLFLGLNKAATESEQFINSLVDRRQKEFLATTALASDPEFSVKEVIILQDLLFHDIAEELVGILDSEPFVRSTKVILKEILADYHERYPSVLRCRILFLFCSNPFTEAIATLGGNKLLLTRSASVVASNTASASIRVLGGSITVTDVDIDGPFVKMPFLPPAKALSPVPIHAAVARVRKDFDTELDSSWVKVGPAPNLTHQRNGGIGAAGGRALQTDSYFQSIAQAEVMPQSAGTGECSDMKRSKRVIRALDTAGSQIPGSKANAGRAGRPALVAPSIDDTPRIFGISPTDSIIDVYPKIFKNCPKELTQLVAESIRKDWEVTSFLTSHNLYIKEAPVYHLEIVLWELNAQLMKLKEFIDRLQQNPKACDLIDVIEILKVKQRALHEIYFHLLDHTADSHLSYDPEIFGKLPHPLYERALVLSRISLHADNLKSLQSTNPKSPIITKLQDTIKEYEKWLSMIPSYNSQQELLQESVFIDLYLNNLRLSNFWLLPMLPDVLQSITGSHAREAFALNLKKDISGMEEEIRQAKTYLPRMPEDEKMGVFISEIHTLEEKLTLVRGIYEQLNEISMAGNIENNRKLDEVVSTSPIDRDVVETIKRK